MARKRMRKPSAGIGGRIQRCRAEMAKSNVAAYLLTNRPDHYYLAGFSGEDSAALVTPRAVWIISDGRFEESIRQECPWAKVTLRKDSLPQEIGKVCKRLKLKKLAVQPDHMSLETHAAIKKAARPTRLVRAPSIVNAMRLCKDKAELRVLDEAIRIAEEAFRATRRCRPGGLGESAAHPHPGTGVDRGRPGVRRAASGGSRRQPSGLRPGLRVGQLPRRGAEGPGARARRWHLEDPAGERRALT